MSGLVWGCDALFLLRLHFVLSADKSGVGKNLGTTRFRRLSIRRLIDTVCIHLFPPTLAPEAVTLHSVTWFVSPRPWGIFFFFFHFWPPARRHILPGGPVDTPSSLTGASRRLRANKALWLLLPPPGEYLSVSPSCFPCETNDFL